MAAGKAADIYGKSYYLKLAGTIVLLMLSYLANYISLDIVRGMPSTEINFDLIHSIVPYNHAYSIITEIFMLAAFAIFATYVVAYRKYHELPFYFTCIAIFYFVRALILPLTPLQTPFPGTEFGFMYRIMPAGGTFPSGHIGFAFMMFLLIDERNKAMKYLALAFALIAGAFMIISRGHYTIDVIAGMLIAYTVYSVAKDVRAHDSRREI